VNAPRRVVLMLALGAAVVAAGMGFNYVVNPYGAWRVALVDPIYRKLVADRAQMPYLLRTTAPVTVLIGSSRVQMGMRIEQGYRDGVLNASLGAATLPDLARIVDAALLNPHLERIVWGVDFYAFNANHHHRNPLFEARLAGDPRVVAQDALLSLSALDDGGDLLKRALRGRAHLPSTMTATVPWPMDFICDRFAATRGHGLAWTPPANVAIGLAQVQAWFYAGYEFSPEDAAQMRRIVERVRARHVQMILFVPPMTAYELELIRQGGHWGDFDRFKMALAAAGPLWDFAAYNPIARRDRLFLDVLHLKPAAGQEILRIMLGADAQPCDDSSRAVAQSALKVDAESITRVLADEDRRRDAAAAVDSPARRMAAQVLRNPQSRAGAEPAEDQN